MITQQLDLFEDLFAFVNDAPAITNVKASKYSVEEESQVADVRSMKQKNRKVSYDVGEKVGGARKDIEEMRRRYLNKPSAEVIEEIAMLDEVAANDLVKKAPIFSWFSLEDCFNRQVHIDAAYGMFLFIRRIPKELNSESTLTRSTYMGVLLFLSELFKSVSTVNDFKKAFSRLRAMCIHVREHTYREKQLEAIRREIHEYLSKSEDIEEMKLREMDVLGELNANEIGNALGLHHLGPITELLLTRKKIRAFNDSMQKYKSWDHYFEENGKKTSQKGVTRKSVWERQLPIEPKREGGQEVEIIKSPEQFKEYFGFRAVQFGLWVKDIDSLGHIQNATKALVDLADVLQVDKEKLSLGNELAIAFGARGKGRAMGHYEQGYNIVNLTKEKGSLGILAHEWFHGFDHYLKTQIAPGEDGFLTQGEKTFLLPNEISETYEHLMQTIKDGESTATIDVTGFKGKYRLASAFVLRYERLQGDLQVFMDEIMEDFDERADRHLQMTSYEPSRLALKEKYARKRKKTLRETAEALSQLHVERTSSKVNAIPYTTNQTVYYRTAIELDKGNLGKYWSKNLELTARAFESYIHSLLKERGWKSHYLVAGVDYIYPQGNEAVKIHAAMHDFIKSTISYL